ncbi:TetR/AcrR family transcriptional regulator [Stenotrophomonas maltophilia]|uniref:TetR/AcrR family transcriptional regulator n=1 Tax=Stenotrophomonas maltophilia TaxID=40324 RepID=UPI001FA6C1E6|nr:TetR/AcrR family transcriptional regulator [Stenotrophomonas maltophilia]
MNSLKYEGALNQAPSRSPGRPRSEASRVAVLNATSKLLETSKVRDLSIEAIASEAGVSKATIYRWWPNKNSVVIDSFIGQMHPSTPEPSGRSAMDTLAEHLTVLVKQYGGALGRLVAEILAEGQSDQVLCNAFRERFFLLRRAAVRAVIERGVATGEFVARLNIDATLDALYGAVYFRLLMGHEPLDARFSKALITTARTLLTCTPFKGERA